MVHHRMPIFDGDGHVLENEDEIVEYYEGKYAKLDRYPAFAIFPTLDGWARSFMVASGDAGRKHHVTDARVWGEMLDDIGAEGTVLYPTTGLAAGLITDHEWAVATATAYNNWLEERYTKLDDRLFAAGMLAVQEPAAAAEELERCAKSRIRFPAMVLPSVTWTGRTYGDEYFWPIFAAAEKFDMPLAIHGGVSRGMGFDHFREFAKIHALVHPVPVFTQLTDMMLSGVFEKFPKLRIAFLEAGCSWVPFMMDRLDYEYDSMLGAKVRERLSKRPSDYFRDGDQIWLSLELGERGLKYTVDSIGPDRIMYASDYPHEPTHEDIVGDVPKFLADDSVDDEIKKNVLYNNAKRFYRI